MNEPDDDMVPVYEAWGPGGYSGVCLTADEALRLALGRSEPKPTIPEVLPRYRAYVSQPKNSVGGALHLWLEEGNVSDGALRECEKWATEDNDTEGVELARLGLRLSRTQRLKLSGLVWRP